MSARSRLAAQSGGWTIALARIATGWMFIQYGWFSKVKDPKFIAGMEATLQKMMESSAFHFYRPFLAHVAITHPHFFGHLVAWGETLLGVSLLLGALTNLASLCGIFMLLNLYLASQSWEAAQLGILCLAFLWLSAGSRLGLDSLLAQVFPERLVYFPRG